MIENSFNFRDGKKIQHAEEIEITFDGKVAALHIKEAKVEHAGDYMCVVKNQFGEAITKASVLVVSHSILKPTHFKHMVSRLRFAPQKYRYSDSCPSEPLKRFVFKTKLGK